MPALAAAAADPDAPLFDLLDRWRAASALTEAADRRFWQAETAAHVEPPAALIKTEADQRIFYDKQPIGTPFSNRTLDGIAEVVGIIATIRQDGDYLQKVVDRFIEIRDAHREHYAAVESARRRAGYYEALAEQVAACTAEGALRREVANARPRTLPGLLAKLEAIAATFGFMQALEEDGDFDDGEIVSLDALALTLLRDCAAILAGSGATA